VELWTGCRKFSPGPLSHANIALRNLVGLSVVLENARRRHGEQRSVIAGDEMAEDALEARIRGGMIWVLGKRVCDGDSVAKS